MIYYLSECAVYCITRLQLAWLTELGLWSMLSRLFTIALVFTGSVPQHPTTLPPNLTDTKRHTRTALLPEKFITVFTMQNTWVGCPVYGCGHSWSPVWASPPDILRCRTHPNTTLGPQTSIYGAKDISMSQKSGQWQLSPDVRTGRAPCFVKISPG